MHGCGSIGTCLACLPPLWLACRPLATSPPSPPHHAGPLTAILGTLRARPQLSGLRLFVVGVSAGAALALKLPRYVQVRACTRAGAWGWLCAAPARRRPTPAASPATSPLMLAPRTPAV